jgi:hypothetical protein
MRVRNKERQKERKTEEKTFIEKTPNAAMDDLLSPSVCLSAFLSFCPFSFFLSFFLFSIFCSFRHTLVFCADMLQFWDAFKDMDLQERLRKD